MRLPRNVDFFGPVAIAAFLGGCGANGAVASGGVPAPAPESGSGVAGASDAVVYVARVVHTLDPAHPKARGVRVEKGRITHVLEGEVPAELSGKRVDLGEAAVLPGLVDAHLHLRSLGAAQRELDLNGTRSVGEIAAKVREAAAKAAPGTWIRGRGWDQNDWDKKEFPGHASLDEVAGGHPVILERTDGHAVWVSGDVLALASVDAATKAPAGGEILHDANGSPSGVFIDNAMGLVEGKVPPASKAEIREDLEKAMELCRRVGLTGVHDMGTEPAVLNELLELEREGKVTLRVMAYLGGPWTAVEPLLQKPPRREGMVRAMGIKLFADGALGSRGAALLAPYSDRPDASGLLVTPPEELYRRAKIAHDAGYDVTIHAIGDRGNRIALDALAKAEGNDRSHRHRIEHAQVLSPQDIGRFAALGIIASMQPTHATSDMPWAEARLGPERIQGAYAWRTLSKAGATLIFGSDAPVEGENPWWGIHAAVTRTDSAGLPRGGWRAQEKLDVLEAIAAFSKSPDEVARLANVGVIRPGAEADLTVVAADPVAIAPEALRAMRTLRTVVSGKEVFVQGGGS